MHECFSLSSAIDCYYFVLGLNSPDFRPAIEVITMIVRNATLVAIQRSVARVVAFGSNFPLSCYLSHLIHFLVLGSVFTVVSYSQEWDFQNQIYAKIHSLQLLHEVAKQLSSFTRH